jgi:hypothetical protein
MFTPTGRSSKWRSPFFQAVSPQIFADKADQQLSAVISGEKHSDPVEALLRDLLLP